MKTQQESFDKTGRFDHWLPSPTKEEALAMAMAKINSAFSPKKKLVQIGNANYYELNGQVVEFVGMVK